MRYDTINGFSSFSEKETESFIRNTIFNVKTENLYRRS